MTTAAQPRWSTVAIPNEHGGWSLTLEPALLGLIVAPSPAGWLLALAALSAFLLRTPLKLWSGDRWRRRRLARTPLAARAALAYALVLAGAVVLAGGLATSPFWLPLAAAVPLFAVELAFDLRGRGRRLAPELAGTVGVGSVAAAIALAGGADTGMAVGLWGVVASRALASIPYVRVQLRRAKSQPHRVASSDLGQLLALGVALAVVGLTPVGWAAAVSITLLAGWQLVTSRLSPPRAPILGAQQVALGLTVVLLTGLGSVAP